MRPGVLGTVRHVKGALVPSRAVSLTGAVREPIQELARRAGSTVDPVIRLDAVLGLAGELGAELPKPGGGRTLLLWEALATLGAVDLTVARAVEPHLDALAILAEAASTGHPVAPQDHDARWGVFAAEGGGRLYAENRGGNWFLSGQKPWCSMADRLSHALVTAWVDDHSRGLFAVQLGHPGIRGLDGSPWVARGLSDIRSAGLDLESVPAIATGGPGWYLERPGFAWGGIGVAAVWFGGAVALARRLHAAGQGREPDQVALMHLGAADVALARARAVLLDAARTVDGAEVTRASAEVLALRVRHVVADTVEEVLTRCAHALGPGPLATEEEHARRVADLTLYVRQHHAERDTAALGRACLVPTTPVEWSWW